MGVSRYRYVHYDVFTDRRFGGNQLAVFTQAAGLSAHAMQQMAREIGLAESTFVMTSERAGADVRERPARVVPGAARTRHEKRGALDFEPARCQAWKTELDSRRDRVV